MNIKGAILFGLGAIIALLSGVGVFLYTRAVEGELHTTRAEMSAFGDMVQVPVASREITRGSVVSAEDFGTMTMPVDSLPTNAMRELPPLPEGVGGYTAFTDMQAGQIMLAADLGSGSGQPDLGYTLSADGRAILLPAGNLAEVGTLLTTGSRADVFWTHDGPAGSETRLLASSLRVLQVTPEAGTLLLDGLAEDAAAVFQAAETGHFDVLPSGSAARSADGEIVVGQNDLATLPLVVRQGAGGGEILPMLGGAKTCTLTVVRSAERSTVDVPC